MERLSPPAPSPPAPSSPDWTVKTADTIEAVVTTVRDRTVAPVTLVAKAMVYGIIVSVAALVLTICLAVAVVRILNEYALPDWLSLTVVGGTFALVGLLVLTRAWAARRNPD